MTFLSEKRRPIQVFLLLKDVQNFGSVIVSYQKICETWDFFYDYLNFLHPNKDVTVHIHLYAKPRSPFKDALPEGDNDRWWIKCQ